MMRLELATAEYIGARAQQQDLAAAMPLAGGAVLVLADGLGGHESGAEASRIVVETFKEAGSKGLFDRAETRRQALRDTVERANQRIANGVDPAHGQRGMASTVVAAVVAGGELSWVSVGDSHLYVWRGGRLAKLNEDHSQAGLMVRSGQYKPDDPEVQAVRSVLVSALTGRKLDIVDLPQRTFKVEAGDVLMLASDGLNTLDDEEIGQIVADVHGDGAVRLSTVLLETVRGRRAERQDNATVAVARVLAAPPRVELEPPTVARTITHQISVPMDLDLEPKTERAPVLPAEVAPESLRDQPEPAAAEPVPVPADGAGATERHAGPSGTGESTPSQQRGHVASEGAAREPAPRNGADGARRPAGVLASTRRGLDAVAAERVTAAVERAAAEIAPAAPDEAGVVTSGRSRLGIGRGLLAILLVALTALGALAALKPDWLPGGWLPGARSVEPAAVPAKPVVPAAKIETPAATGNGSGLRSGAIEAAPAAPAAAAVPAGATTSSKATSEPAAGGVAERQPPAATQPPTPVAPQQGAGEAQTAPAGEPQLAEPVQPARPSDRRRPPPSN